MYKAITEIDSISNKIFRDLSILPGFNYLSYPAKKTLSRDYLNTDHGDVDNCRDNDKNTVSDELFAKLFSFVNETENKSSRKRDKKTGKKKTARFRKPNKKK